MCMRMVVPVGLGRLKMSRRQSQTFDESLHKLAARLVRNVDRGQPHRTVSEGNGTLFRLGINGCYSCCSSAINTVST